MKLDDLTKKAKTLDWSGLHNLWRQLREKDVCFDDWGGKGNAFQYLIVRAFELSEGVDEVQYPFKVGFPHGVNGRGPCMEEIDGFVRFRHISCLIESKNEADAIDIEPIAKIRDKLLRRPAGTVGSVFSMQGYTLAAMILVGYCAPQAIMLWHGTEIGECIQHRNMATTLANKFHHVQKFGHQDFDPGRPA